MGAKVYFSRTITPEKVVELYELAGKKLTRGWKLERTVCLRNRGDGLNEWRTPHQPW